MKTLNTLALTVLLTSMSVSAQEAAETTREINAQTTVTRGHIDNILQRMNERRTDSRFNARDYWAQNPQFKGRVDSALKNFEDELEKGILAKAAYWMNQYNTIATSTEFSPEQKAILLRQRLENIRAQFKTLSQEYQTSLTKVYNIVAGANSKGRFEILTPADKGVRVSRAFERTVKVRYVDGKTVINSQVKVAMKDGGEVNRFDLVIDYPGAPLVIKASTYYGYGEANTVPGVTRNDDGRFYGVMLDYSTLIDLKRMTTLQNSVFQRFFYPELRKSCQSMICLGLLSADHTALLTLIKTNLDRTIKMTLADGNEVQLMSLQRDISLQMSQLARVDYPEELPFDL